ncbi:MAG: mCpol domain-containing protein [Desulfobacteraceae bacterium]|jgi:hypothetical protein
MFLAYDGDKVGAKLESLLIENDEIKIESFAKEVSFVLNLLKNSLLEKGCKIIFASGDSLLAKCNNQFDPDNIKRTYGQISFSLGIGNSPLEAMLALKKAKANGRGGYKFYTLKECRE